MCLFIFSFLNPLYLLLHQDEEMNVLDQLRETSKKKAKLGKQIEEKERKRRKRATNNFKRNFYSN
jgi:hypothetical protein